MGARGPLPKRSSQRRRANKPTMPVTKAAAGAAATDVKPIEQMTGAELNARAAELGIVDWKPRARIAQKRDALIAHVAGANSTGIPDADPNWHDAAKRWYVALAKSGQSAFYEASDWAFAWIAAESLSRDLKPQVVGIVEETGEVVRAIIPIKGASLAAYLKAMTALLATEGDRRRAGIELERASGGPDPADSDVTSLDDYRARFAN